MAQTSAQKCYICIDKYSVFYCYDCQHALCAVCRERHDKIPAVSGHTITDINGIDLSNVNSDKSRCVTHKKDYLYYCAKCSDLICGKCVTSSHKGHSFSEISEIVSDKRKVAQTALQKLKSQIDNISSLKDSVRVNHTDKLHNASHQNITDIRSTCDDLETFIKSKRDIKKTEVEDNESIEQQCIEQFLKNTDRIHDQYVQVLTELQNLLCEKHDITFYTLYTAIDKDITCLDDIPKEPTFPTVPSFDKKMLCKEILEYIQSKTDVSLCQNCTNLEEKLVEILEEKKELQRDVERKTAEQNTISKEVERLLSSIKDIQIAYAKKLQENEILSTEIKHLRGRNPKLRAKEAPTSTDYS